MWFRLNDGITLVLVFALILSGAGCNREDNKSGKERQAKDIAARDGNKQSKEDDHSGWWCQEHGIPEHLCSQCNAEVAANFKKEGDWCKIHPDRAKSQCFTCDPSRYKRFEDMYVAKYGKKPEPPAKSEFEK
jgi:hypothetical protein